MYTDSAKVRTHEIKIRLDDYEVEALERLVNETGGQRAVIAREIIMRQVMLELERQHSKEQKSA